MVGTIAALTLTRMLRGRVLWVSAIVALLPVAFAFVLRAAAEADGRSVQIVDVFGFEQLVLSVLPALLVAASVGEEIEDRTTTYLWSRPIARWAVLAGKLVAMVPIICVLVAASWIGAATAATGTLPATDSIVAVVLGAIALSPIAAALGTLVPRYAMAIAICYMLFLDLPLGAMPAAIENVSITHHVRVVAGMVAEPPDSSVGSVIGIAIIAVLWGAVALWRIRRLEA